jgi:hypothetical protein
VHVYLNPREGGLNLNMPTDVVAALSNYGTQAADHLIQHFIDGTDGGKPTPMTWDNHRWIRYRSSTSLVQQFLSDYADAMEHPEAGESDIMTLVARGAGDPPPTGYRWQPGQREVALDVTEKLRTLGDEMKGKDLETGSPKPEPALRVRPKF